MVIDSSSNESSTAESESDESILSCDAYDNDINMEDGEASSSNDTCDDDNKNDNQHSENSFEIKDPFLPLYQSADVTNFEAFLCILAFCVRFNLSGVCTDELLRLLKILLPPCNIPGSKYLLNQTVKSAVNFDSFCKIHLSCANCKSYISEMENYETEILCSVCKEKMLSSDLLEGGHFFIYVPLEHQLKQKFEKQNVFEDIEKLRENCVDNTTYKDITDGKNYTMPDFRNSVSLQFNVDGIPVYNKSKFDLWPIHCMINELPLAKRKENIIMCGLWFGPNKPNFKSYLVPFITELTLLCERGLIWNRNGKTVVTKIVPLLCTADAPARAMLQNFKQFNGKYGCSFCENEGERVVRGRGHSRIYKLLQPVPEKRTFQKTVKYAEKALNSDKTIKGVKGSSLLMQLYPHFDMIEGFVPDYMHSVLLGVTRQFVNLWLSPSDETYCLKKKKKENEINERIRNLKEPSEMKRKLRSLSQIAYWKASEWRIFLLTSPVLLLNIIDCEIYRHWILLVHGVTLLLGSSISNEDLQIAESALHKFVKGVAEIYGEGELTYNVHLLLHLSEKVKSWGPLWASSCFPYEDALGRLKNFHQGTKGVPLQILDAYLKKTLMQTLIVKQGIKNDRVQKFVDDMHRGKKDIKKAVAINNVTVFGSGKNEILPKVQKEALEKKLNVCLSNNRIMTYKRALYKKKIFTTKEYSEQFSRVDSLVSILSTKTYLVEILKIVVYNDKIIFLGTKLKKQKFSKTDIDVGDLCSNIWCVKSDKKTNDKSIIAFEAECILQKYTQLKLENIYYFVPLLFHAEE